MSRQTVDYGIDLGTTNSVIAKATKTGVKIIKNRLHGEITPSAVVRTSRGQILVGQDALDKTDLSPALQFKRLMGTTHRLSLQDGSELLPEELSAEVLKELKSAVQLRYDEVLEHVVITVPAMFQQPQCEATHRAAELAGLKAVTLLQEPIAAATACISDDPEEGDYLVYDLGGGTFDVSIVRLKDGEMSVIAHGGDNYLGGSDFDQAVYGWLLNQLERKHGSLPELHAQPAKHVLLKACESAKIRLSDQEQAMIDLGDLQLPESQMHITRKVLEDLIESQVDRTISLARERLDQAGLSPSDITSILMVGGQTQTPFIRDKLRDELEIRLSFEQDPMTVVAYGSALHAGSVLKPDRARSAKKSAPTAASIELYYDPVSPDLVTTVSGKVVEPGGFTGELRLSNASGDWDSGWIPLKSGAFATEVRLESNGPTEFVVSLRDLQGTMWAVDPESISIRYGVAAAKAVTSYQYSVALEDGKTGVVLDYNQALPAPGRKEFKAAKTVPAGSAEELVIYFVEGNSPVAKDNVRVGTLVINGRELSRTLREGELVEVRIFMDESRRIKARVLIPLHDLEYDVELYSMIDTPPIADLLASMSELQETVSEIGDLAEEEDTDVVLQTHRDLEQLEAEVGRIGSGEPGQAERVAHRLAESKSRVRPLQAKYGIQVKHQEVLAHIGWAEGMVAEHEDNIGKASLGDLKAEAERCLRLDDEKGLDLADGRVLEIFWKHYVDTEECWIGFVEYLREQRRFAKEPIAYDEYLKRAEDCLARRDFEGTRLNGFQARSLLPDSKVKENRFWDAGLRA